MQRTFVAYIVLVHSGKHRQCMQIIASRETPPQQMRYAFCLHCFLAAVCLRGLWSRSEGCQEDMAHSSFVVRVMDPPMHAGITAVSCKRGNNRRCGNNRRMFLLGVCVCVCGVSVYVCSMPLLTSLFHWRALGIVVRCSDQYWDAGRTTSRPQWDNEDVVHTWCW